MEGANWQAECRMLDLCDLLEAERFSAEAFY